ncbi:hypothetical protein [Micromonospora halophytica]|uniref:Uncharacterized protein n=1 Tax=Micromonospora halophytica TaxID=47864 RepID=A0A1C5H6R3_9ACTN|nr:hypothetical protein [Micromonospora halophytica]SCG41131.1 hypothetical protein GA0070560_103107 [Micromonospora halophytica]
MPAQGPPLYAYDPVDGAVDPAEELIVTEPFDIRLRLRDVAP